MIFDPTALYLIGESFVYILEAFVLLWIAKFAYSKLYRRVELNAELFSRDNQALAISTAGFYFGILIALGGAISGESQGLRTDAVMIGVYGLSAIALMLLASVMCEKILLPTFNNTKEVCPGSQPRRRVRRGRRIHRQRPDYSRRLRGRCSGNFFSGEHIRRPEFRHACPDGFLATRPDGAGDRRTAVRVRDPVQVS